VNVNSGDVAPDSGLLFRAFSIGQVPPVCCKVTPRPNTSAPIHRFALGPGANPLEWGTMEETLPQTAISGDYAGAEAPGFG
jgi:hypothetical protein